MPKIWKIFIIIIITLFVMVGAIYFCKIQYFSNGLVAGFIEEPGRGFCEGITDPQELEKCGADIKPLPLDSDICAENVDSKKLYCIFQKEFGNYKLQAPAGNYYIFTKSKNGHVSYYNEFTACGRKEGCSSYSFKRAVVKIFSNKTTNNINIDGTDQSE